MRALAFDHAGRTEVAKLDVLAVLTQKDICSFEIAMNDVVLMKVDNRIKDLARVGKANRFAKPAIHFTLVVNAAQRHVLKIDTKHVILNHLAAVVSHDIRVVEVLEPVHLLFQSLDLVLVNAEILVNKVQFFDAENLPGVEVLRFINFTSNTLADHFSLTPLPKFAVDFLSLPFVQKVVLLDLNLGSKLAF